MSSEEEKKPGEAPSKPPGRDASQAAGRDARGFAQQPRRRPRPPQGEAVFND